MKKLTRILDTPDCGRIQNQNTMVTLSVIP